MAASPVLLWMLGQHELQQLVLDVPLLYEWRAGWTSGPRWDSLQEYCTGNLGQSSGGAQEVGPWPWCGGGWLSFTIA